MPNPIVPGNIDLYHRPRVLNPDGSVSTVYSRGVNDGGLEVLIPSLIPTAEGGYRTDLSKRGDDAMEQYRRTGQHLGKFRTPEESDAYGEALHNDYAAGKYDASGKPNLSVNGTPIEMATGHRVDQQVAMRAMLMRMMRGGR